MRRVLLATSTVALVTAFTGPHATLKRSLNRNVLQMVDEPVSEATRRQFVGTAGVLGVSGWVGPTIESAQAAQKSTSWSQVETGIEQTIFDIAFDTADKSHGFAVGSKGTFLETKNGGVTWAPRSFLNLDPEDEINYRFEGVEFKDGESWILGKPAILLHTTDAGKSWERVPLSPKLPGEPNGIVALGPNSAEMTTSTGAIYSTTNSGRNWKALVKETIDATLNRVSSSGVSGASYFTGSVNSIVRDETGAYLAVSSRGNFYLTWTPGDDFWIPHNRGTPRRIQAMGFIDGKRENGLWMSLNGGLLQSTAAGVDLNADQPEFNSIPIKTGGYGIIDLAWNSPRNEVWAVGGGGTMYVSRDGGKSFKFDNAADNIPGNLYRVLFDKAGGGFVLGSDGVLLREAKA